MKSSGPVWCRERNWGRRKKQKGILKEWMWFQKGVRGLMLVIVSGLFHLFRFLLAVFMRIHFRVGQNVR